MSNVHELIARAKLGDNLAFADVWHRSEATVTAICRSYLRSSQSDPAVEEADLSTEVFIRALHQLDRYEDRSATGVEFEAWLVQVARRVCLNYVEKQQRRGQWRDAAALDEGIDSQPATSRSVAGLVEERETLRRAAEEINALPELYRTPFRLFLEERSHAEIARGLGISVEGARKRVERARKALRPRMRDILCPSLPDGVRTKRLAPAVRRSNAQLVSREIRAVEQAISHIVCDYRIVTLQLPTGGEVQFTLRAEPSVQREPDIETRRKAIAKRPHAWKKRLELAEICYNFGRWDEARQELHATLAAHPGNSVVALRLGQLLEQVQEQAEAAGVYRRALDQLLVGGHSPAAEASLRARLNSTTGQVAAAVDCFRRAVALAPRDRSNYYGLFRDLGRLSRYEEQIEVLTKLRQMDPLDAFAVAEVYAPCAHLRRFDIAGTILEQAIVRDPNNPDAIKHLFQTRMNLGLRDTLTLQLAERLVELVPDLVDGWNELAWMYSELGREEDGIAGLHQFLERHPNSVRANTELAWRYHYLRQFELEAHHARRAYALAPYDRHACWTILTACASLYAGWITVDEADQFAQEISATFPCDAIVLAHVATYFKTNGRELEALDYATRAVTASPASPEAQACLASVYQWSARWVEASAAFEALVAMAGGRTGQWMASFGEALRVTGDLRADAILTEALEIARTTEDKHLTACVYEAWGKKTMAVRELRQMLDDPKVAAHLRIWAEERLERLTATAPGPT